MKRPPHPPLHCYTQKEEILRRGDAPPPKPKAKNYIVVDWVVGACEV